MCSEFARVARLTALSNEVDYSTSDFEGCQIYRHEHVRGVGF